MGLDMREATIVPAPPDRAAKDRSPTRPNIPANLLVIASEALRPVHRSPGGVDLQGLISRPRTPDACVAGCGPRLRTFSARAPVLAGAFALTAHARREFRVGTAPPSASADPTGREVRVGLRRRSTTAESGAGGPAPILRAMRRWVACLLVVLAVTTSCSEPSGAGWRPSGQDPHRASRRRWIPPSRATPGAPRSAPSCSSRLTAFDRQPRAASGACRIVAVRR